MRRSGPPVRRTRLSRRVWVRTQSARRRREQQQRRAMAPPVAVACWLAIPEVCTGTAQAWHELVGVGVGGSRVDPRNLAAACGACNTGLEAMGERYERGWKVRSSAAVAGVGGLVPARLHPLSLAAREGSA